LVSSERRSLEFLLSRPGGGVAAAIVLGGAPEALDAHPGALRLQLPRTGFVRCALRHGAALVPVFSFGENELFRQVRNPPGSALRALQARAQRALGFALPLFHARGVFQYDVGLLPFRRAVCTVVGRPLLLPRLPEPPPRPWRCGTRGTCGGSRRSSSGTRRSSGSPPRGASASRDPPGPPVAPRQ
ncbi:LOW QUALITY PROTEIN: 2-acylglycerol O-acyltransferase 2-like, partial [Amazona ochrocephala]